MREFLQGRQRRFLHWWRAPVPWWLRLLLAIAGFFYGALASTLIVIFSGLVPIFPANELLSGVVRWALPAAIVCAGVGYMHPKAMFCVINPLSLIGIGNIEMT